MTKQVFELHVTVDPDFDLEDDTSWKEVRQDYVEAIEMFFRNAPNWGSVRVSGKKKLRTFQLFNELTGDLEAVGEHSMFTFKVEYEGPASYEYDHFDRLKGSLIRVAPNGVFRRLKVEVPGAFLGSATTHGVGLNNDPVFRALGWKYVEAHIMDLWGQVPLSTDEMWQIIEKFNANNPDGAVEPAHGVRVLLSDRVRAKKENTSILTMRAMRRGSEGLEDLARRWSLGREEIMKMVGDAQAHAESDAKDLSKLNIHYEVVVYDSHPGLDAKWDPRMETVDPMLRISQGLPAAVEQPVEVSPPRRTPTWAAVMDAVNEGFHSKLKAPEAVRITNSVSAMLEEHGVMVAKPTKVRTNLSAAEQASTKTPLMIDEDELAAFLFQEMSRSEFYTSGLMPRNRLVHAQRVAHSVVEYIRLLKASAKGRETF